MHVRMSQVDEASRTCPSANAGENSQSCKGRLNSWCGCKNRTEASCANSDTEEESTVREGNQEHIIITYSIYWPHTTSFRTLILQKYLSTTASILFAFGRKYFSATLAIVFLYCDLPQQIIGHTCDRVFL